MVRRFPTTLNGCTLFSSLISTDVRNPYHIPSRFYSHILIDSFIFLLSSYSSTMLPFRLFGHVKIRRLQSKHRDFQTLTNSCTTMSTTTRLASHLIRQQASLWTRRTCPSTLLVRPARPLTRKFSTTPFRNATLATHPEGKPTVILSSPSPEYIEQEEINVDLIPPEEVNLVITDRAAEQLRSIATRENNPDAALRVAVESGGCHGYQYRMELATNQSPDDYHFTHPTLQPSNILVDAVSFSLLNGSTIDFATELIGSSFRVAENPKAKGSGCGCGVSWELKE
ncbi:hypothetical protein D9615_002332 [Tricholomella constricta]|uniref:Core domain-containing protein n=1 Tax=Tricholomella constricta TaxID=117010 RepID=A0A8H5M9V1_9AGAR|nr:hypothetical protein D9615_002332 [Tricholomella constricta]